jgi:peptide deformylase
MEIVQIGATVLRHVARRVDPAELQTEHFRDLVAAMHATMKEAPGVGLAAPQIGLSLQVAVVEDPPEYSEAQSPEQRKRTERDSLPFTVLINPSIEPLGTEMAEFFEGCLSVDGYRALVRRHRHIRAHWTGMDGTRHQQEFRGWPARILQHEVDHLRGVVYVDRMLPRSLVTTASWAEEWSDLPIETVHELLRVDAPTPPDP